MFMGMINNWHTEEMRGNKIPRQMFYAAKPVPEHPDQAFRYGYTGWDNATMLQLQDMSMIPPVEAIVNKLNEMCKFEGQSININHCIGTKYEAINDRISEHQDDPKDIRDNTAIWVMSFGDVREMRIVRDTGRTKSSEKWEVVETIVMEPGSMFILGPQTNFEFYHTIVKVKSERAIEREKRADGTPMFGPRISLVLREIKTSISREKSLKRAKEIIKDRADRKK